MALGQWGARIVYVPKPIYRRFKMLAEELETLKGVETNAEELISEVLTEYVRQHFEESTKAVANLFKCPHCG